MMSSAEKISSRCGMLTLLNALASAAFSFFAINNVFDNHGRAAAYMVLWVVWLCVTLAWVFGVPGWKHLSSHERGIVNDELVKAYQADAAKFGLACAVLGLMALSLGDVFGAAMPVWSVPALTTATIVMTALFFAWRLIRDD